MVDDGSSDSTVQVAQRYSQDGGIVRVVRNPGNRGKGFSVKHGMLEAQGEWRLFSDADLSTPIEEFEKLWLVAEQQRAKVVIGSRALNRSLIGVRQPWYREKSGQFFNLVMRGVLRLDIADSQCGFKLFHADAAREIFQRQRLDRFSFDAELLFLARKLGYTIREIPVRWNDVAGSKVTLMNGARSFLDLLRIRANSMRGAYRLSSRT